MTHSQADSALADALWWFRGFSASQPCGRDDQTYNLADNLLAARQWLSDLAMGCHRLIGTNERHYGVALTEYEFEVIDDALRENATAEERDAARVKIKAIFQTLRTEQKLARDEELPF